MLSYSGVLTSATKPEASTDDMTADVESKSKVLYIAGWGRSGTTILGNILGQVEGMFSVGEIRFLWDAETFRDRRCGSRSERRASGRRAR